MRQNDAARLGGRSGSVKNFSDAGSCRGVAWIHFRILCGRRRARDVFEIVDNQGRRRARKLDLLAIAQDELHSCVVDRAFNEIGRCGGIHGNNDRAAQQNPPEASHPLG